MSGRHFADPTLVQERRMAAEMPEGLIQDTKGTESSCRLVLLVDAHPMFRDGLRRLVAREQKLTVCGEAGTVADARRLLDEYKPDLMVLDLELRERDAVTLLEESRGWADPPKVLVLSDHPESDAAVEAMRLGAAGVLSKQSDSAELVRVIRQVCGGRTYLNDEMLKRLMRRKR